MPNTNHTRGYYRDERRKHIRRKKKLIHAMGDYWGYKFDGELSDSKIHCSCGMCMAKTRNKGYKRRHIHGNYAPNINLKHSDKQKYENSKSQLEELGLTLKNLKLTSTPIDVTY